MSDREEHQKRDNGNEGKAPSTSTGKNPRPPPRRRGVARTVSFSDDEDDVVEVPRLVDIVPERERVDVQTDCYYSQADLHRFRVANRLRKERKLSKKLQKLVDETKAMELQYNADIFVCSESSDADSATDDDVVAVSPLLQEVVQDEYGIFVIRPITARTRQQEQEKEQKQEPEQKHPEEKEEAEQQQPEQKGDVDQQQELPEQHPEQQKEEEPEQQLQLHAQLMWLQQQRRQREEKVDGGSFQHQQQQQQQQPGEKQPLSPVVPSVRAQFDSTHSHSNSSCCAGTSAALGTAVAA